MSIETALNGALIHYNPFLRAPLVMSLNQLLLAAVVGMAKGVNELFESRVGNRMDLHTGKPSAQSAGAQLRFAESSAEVDVAEMRTAKKLRQIGGMGQNRSYN